MTQTALVNKIIPFSSVDGPGNRTAIFLQGCNINCRYCHNPETRAVCISCGTCVAQCPAGALSLTADGRVSWDPAKCVQCDTCIHVCPHNASPRVIRMTPEEVMKKVERQIPFIRGISVSGGECMLHPDFLTELFTIAKKTDAGAGLPLTTLIDSNGTIDFRQNPALMQVSDGVMLDIKAFDSEDHRRITDAPNETVLENARWLAEHERLYEIRCVIAPHLYDVRKSVQGAGEFLLPLYLKQLEKEAAGDYRQKKKDPKAVGIFRPFRFKLIACRPMGVRPAYSGFAQPGSALMQELSDLLKAMGYRDIVVI
ncbi:MAG: YjjW family glycine radical enzyme activase [Lachnospiraceae bacterium]|nr:YjjW family glycine radical enzyme activase [Lachnospiraceae bacterium]